MKHCYMWILNKVSTLFYDNWITHLFYFFWINYNLYFAWKSSISRRFFKLVVIVLDIEFSYDLKNLFCTCGCLLFSFLPLHNFAFFFSKSGSQGICLFCWTCQRTSFGVCFSAILFFNFSFCDNSSSYSLLFCCSFLTSKYGSKILYFFLSAFIFNLLFFGFVVVVFYMYLFILAALGLSCGMLTLSCVTHVGSSSLTRAWTRAPCIGSAESYPLDHQGSPFNLLFLMKTS